MDPLMGKIADAGRGGTSGIYRCSPSIHAEVECLRPTSLVGNSAHARKGR
jgi:hypothetical protein